jgi:nitronate monooxygenase
VVRRDRTVTRGVSPVLMANLIVGRQNKRLGSDLESVVRRSVPLVVTSAGDPRLVIEPLHEVGRLIVASVASVAHAQKAIAAGADGLVLLRAGGGGHTGWANPFAFVRAVHATSDIPLIATGGMIDGASLWAAVLAGYDLGMFGTRFIATSESGASDTWRAAPVDSTMDDVIVGSAPNGITASLLRAGGGSAGHSVSAVSRSMAAAEVVSVASMASRQADTSSCL